MWVKVKTQKSFWLGILYRPHYSDIINEECGESILEKNISKVTEKSSQIILTGDFNIDLRDKDQYDTTTLKNICKAYGMSQYIKKVTRFDKKGKGTTIDHIWATPEADIVKAGTIPGISDHLGTYCKINKHPVTKQKPIIKVRNFQKYDAQEFINYTESKINNSAINTCLKNKNVNSATETLLKVINESLEKFAPLKEITLNRKRKGLPWITEEIRELTEEKNQMLLDSYSHGFEKYKKRIKKMTNLINCRKRNEKKKFISEEIEKAGLDVRRLWKLLNMLTGRGKSKKNVEPDNITQNTANEYNKYFATIGTKIQEELNFKKPLKPIPNNKRSELPEFVFKNENATKIKKIIENIKNNVAVGCDNIGIRIINDLKEIIAPILANIINIGYESQCFPDCMKEGVIKPIYKKEDRNNISNYRPITVLPTISKVFERSAADQIIEYLESHGLISRKQHAYRKGHSSNTCLMESTNFIYKNKDQNKYTALVSLDLSKAFDSIDHQLLLDKMSNLGMSVQSINWIKSYLSNRRQRTRFSEFTSSETVVTAGIPQGSILGPLLFTCFTNDMSALFDDICKMIAYADDTQLLVTADSIEELKINALHAIKKAQEWFTSNSMKNNVGKTDLIIFTPKANTEEFHINTEFLDDY